MNSVFQEYPGNGISERENISQIVTPVKRKHILNYRLTNVNENQTLLIYKNELMETKWDSNPFMF